MKGKHLLKLSGVVFELNLRISPASSLLCTLYLKKNISLTYGKGFSMSKNLSGILCLGLYSFLSLVNEYSEIIYDK